MTLSHETLARSPQIDRIRETLRRPRTNPALNPYNDGSVPMPHGDYINSTTYQGAPRWSKITPALTRADSEPFHKGTPMHMLVLAFSCMENALKDATRGRAPDEYEVTYVYGGRVVLLYFFNKGKNTSQIPYQIVLTETFFADNCRTDEHFEPYLG